jgi:hypothetical protein
MFKFFSLCTREKGFVHRMVSRPPHKRVYATPPAPHLDTIGARGTHSLAVEEVGGANSDDLPETLALCILCGVYDEFC